MDFQKDSITYKRFAIKVAMKYLYSFVISVTTYYVFQSMSMPLPELFLINKQNKLFQNCCMI